MFCHGALQLAVKKKKKTVWVNLCCFENCTEFFALVLTSFRQVFENNSFNTRLFFEAPVSCLSLSLLIHSSPALMSGLALVINAIQQVFAQDRLSTRCNRTEPLLALQALCRGSIHRRVLNKTA